MRTPPASWYGTPDGAMRGAMGAASVGRDGREPATGWSGYVRHLRKRRGWTIADLARELGIAARTIGYWEAGVTRPSPVFARLLRAVGDQP